MEYPNAIAVLRHEIEWLGMSEHKDLDASTKARWVEEFESAIKKLEA